MFENWNKEAAVNWKMQQKRKEVENIPTIWNRKVRSHLTSLRRLCRNQWSLSCWHFRTWCKTMEEKAGTEVSTRIQLFYLTLAAFSAGSANFFLFIPAKFSDRIFMTVRTRDCCLAKNRASIQLTRATWQQRQTFLLWRYAQNSAVLFASTITESLHFSAAVVSKCLSKK